MGVRSGRVGAALAARCVLRVAEATPATVTHISGIGALRPLPRAAALEFPDYRPNNEKRRGQLLVLFG